MSKNPCMATWWFTPGYVGDRKWVAPLAVKHGRAALLPH